MFKLTTLFPVIFKAYWVLPYETYVGKNKGKLLRGKSESTIDTLVLMGIVQITPQAVVDNHSLRFSIRFWILFPGVALTMDS